MESSIAEAQVEIKRDADLDQRGKQIDENCVIEGNFDVVIHEFQDLNLKTELLKGIYSHGFQRPSPIQARAIVPCIAGRDVLAQAQSGTGKTATFVISSLQRVDVDFVGGPQVLVVVPTRELALQILSVYVNIGQYMKVKCLNLIGGLDINQDKDQLRNKNPHVIICTAGRACHLLQEGHLDLSSLKVIILDEADAMLDRSFIEGVYGLFKSSPTDVQVILLSATFPQYVEDIIEKFMRDPIRLVVKKEQLTLQVIKQYYTVVPNRNVKVDAVIDILKACSAPQMLIFCNRTDEATTLCNILRKEGFEAEFLHSVLSQQERQGIMDRFRTSETKLLISTNLISRGIDIQTVSMVINFDFPRDKETYLHRIGRSGRYGRRGMAINLILEGELPQVKEMEQFYGTTIAELPANFYELL
ncbi:Eukaryotic initiation factor 4A [Thelohanellus kitauei]|uniref:RNA helicase n=1 Tax=Thelohanellus kitauei TaxID=669202 RepID=A0A0C2IER9_THEKT|nr:Eukaryotic initiation factor 4A [Thelohanellus kitauei]